MAQDTKYYRGFAIQETLSHLEGLLAADIQELARRCPRLKELSITGTSVGAICGVRVTFEYMVQRKTMEVGSNAERGRNTRKKTEQKVKEDVHVELCSRRWVPVEYRVEGKGTKRTGMC